MTSNTVPAGRRAAAARRRLTLFLAATIAGCTLLGAAPAARAVVWEVHNNANDLVSVERAGNRVWCLSLNGVHAFDPSTGSFERHFRQPAGLVSNRAVGAAQDGFGNVWVGTDGGGSAFVTPDGRWRSVTGQQGLPSDSVRALEPLGDGMWVGTSAGLAFFVGVDIVGAIPDGVNPSPFASNDVRAIETFGTRTWIGTTNGVYTSTDGVNWQPVNAGLGSTDIRSLAHDGIRLWALSAGGLAWWEGNTGTWSAAPTVGGGRRLSASGGLLHVAAPSGVWRWDEGAQVWQSLGGPSATDVDADGAASVWASSSAGLWRYNGTSWGNIRSPGPIGNWIHGMDVQGEAVYVSTRLGGTSRFDDARGWRTFLGGAAADTSFRSSDFHFGCFVDREGYKWVGDWGGSIARFDDSGPTTAFTHFFDSSPDSVDYTIGWAAAHDPTGPRWIGLDTRSRGSVEPRGLIRIDNDGTRSFFEPGTAVMSGRQIRAIAFAPDNSMWVGYADAGVDVFQDRTLQSRIAHIDVGPNALVNPDVWSIVFEGSDAWILCSGSLVKLRLTGTTTSRQATLFLPSVSDEGAVHPMTLDGNNAIWVATTGGLFRRDPGGSVTSLTVANSPLLSNDAHSVVYNPTTGDVWVGTLLGLNRLRPDPPPSNERIADLPALVISPNPQRISAIGSRFQVRAGNGEPLARTDVRIYDLRGRLVSVQRTDDLGQLFWEPVDRFGNRLGVGVYFLRSYEFDENGRLTASGNGRLVLGP